MHDFKGKTLSWKLSGGIVEVELHYAPCNEIGTAMLEELERLVHALPELESHAAALIIYSSRKEGFSAGGDLRELYRLSVATEGQARAESMRAFILRVHHVANSIDASPLTTIAAVHGICFGGGFELALTCDLIVADKMARFAFPELRLGIIPGFGGIPRLRRDVGNAVVRDLLFTGRSINAAKAQSVGLVSQVAAEGEALRLARTTAAQVLKYDRHTSAVCKKFAKPIPLEELRRETEIFCELFGRPAVMEALRKFVESTDAHPYLP
ncbi:MAG: enoyl-CoA hydratase/isomerase family protein [Candidatus Acidiferrales bacterium]